LHRLRSKTAVAMSSIGLDFKNFIFRVSRFIANRLNLWFQCLALTKRLQVNQFINSKHSCWNLFFRQS